MRGMEIHTRILIAEVDGLLHDLITTASKTDGPKSEKALQWFDIIMKLETQLKAMSAQIGTYEALLHDSDTKCSEMANRIAELANENRRLKAEIDKIF